MSSSTFSATDFLNGYTKEKQKKFNTSDLNSIDPSSGFPYNPGVANPIDFDRQPIEDIKDKTDERLDGIRPDRVSPEDTLTSSYTQSLMDGGVLPGSEGYISPSEKDENRLAGDLAIKDAFSADEMDKRNTSYENIIRMNAEVAADRRNARADELLGEGGNYDRMMDALMSNAYGSESNPGASILDYFPEQVESEPGKDKDKDKNKNKNKNKENEAIVLPELIDRPEGSPLTTELYNAAQNSPEFNKNVSFDGRDFDYFLQRAQSVNANVDPDDDEGGTTNFANIMDLDTNQRLNNEYTYNDPNKADLYLRLQAEGLSDDDMLKAAQSAGLSNVKTGKEGMDDFNQIIDAYNKGFYEGDEYSDGSLKSEQDLLDWYNSQGDDLKKVKLKKAQKKAGYETYDSEEDAQALMDFLSGKLQRQGIVGEPNKKDMKAFNKQMDSLDNIFGKKVTYKEYKNALEGNKASDVNSWMEQYMNLGGGVGKRVQDKIGDKNNMPSTDLQDGYFNGMQMPEFENNFGMKDYENALNVINDPKATGDYMLALKSQGIDFRPKLTNQYTYLR